MNSHRLFVTTLMFAALTIGATPPAFAEDDSGERKPNPALFDPSLATEKE